MRLVRCAAIFNDKRKPTSGRNEEIPHARILDSDIIASVFVNTRTAFITLEEEILFPPCYDVTSDSSNRVIFGNDVNKVLSYIGRRCSKKKYVVASERNPSPGC